MEQEQTHRTLPPNVDGDRIGTLLVRFEECSIPNVFARIQFWGNSRYYDLTPRMVTNASEATISTSSNASSQLESSIEYGLVGAASAVRMYMKDASPLHIKILDKDSFLIGDVFITDLSLPEQSLDCKRSSRGVISRHRHILGDATFELHFRMMSTQLQLDTALVTQPMQQLVDIPDFEVNHLLLDQQSDSGYQVSEFCSSDTQQEKFSLISELLDICSDDSTIPTVDTSLVAETGVDPYDLWISNIVSSAASPPRTSSRSLFLQQVGTMEVVIDKVFLSNNLLINEMDGKHDFFVQYNLPPPSTSSVKFTVCRQFGKQQTKMWRVAPKMAGRISKLDGKPTPTHSQLLDQMHTKQTKIEFVDDETVRHWMDCKMTFDLYRCVSNPFNAHMSLHAHSTTTLVGQSSVSLKDVILSDSLAISTTVFLMDKSNKKVGQLSLRMRLLTHDGSDINTDKTENGNITITSRAQPKEATELESSLPHPISLFLSNVATAANNAARLRSSAAQPEGPLPLEHHPPCNPASQKLEPIEPPPIWIDVRVYSISELQIDHAKSKRLVLNLKCSDPLLSLCDLVQSRAFRDDSTQNYSTDSVLSIEAINDCDNIFSTATQLSWQAGLKTLNGETVITLQLRSCCNDEEVLVGIVSIPFQRKQREGSSGTHDFLPRFEANGWLDILSPHGDSSTVGKIQLSLATGTLKQIRSLPKAQTCATSIQRLWMKTMRNVTRCDPSSLDEFEAINASIEKKDDAITFDGNSSPTSVASDNVEAKSNLAISSPDSLFEEWSQQSYLAAAANKDEDEMASAKIARADKNDVDIVVVDTSLAESTKQTNDIPTAEITTTNGPEGRGDFTFNPTTVTTFSAQNLLRDMDETYPRRRKPIDPPEEDDLLSKPRIDNKRKMDCCLIPDPKRHRYDGIPSGTTVLEVTKKHPCETNVPVKSAPETEDSSVEEDDSMTYRSLQSVLQSLAGIETRIKEADLSHLHPTSVLGCRDEDFHLADASSRSELTPHSPGSMKSSPLNTPFEKCKTNAEPTTVKTCEKGTSPLFIVSRYKDAATSPCEEEGSKEAEEEGVGGAKDARETDSKQTIGAEPIDLSCAATSKLNKNRADEVQGKETEDATIYVDNGTKFQMDWNSIRLTSNHSTTQGFFPTVRTSSDRRERYGNLFNKQSCPHGSTFRLGGIPSPTDFRRIEVSRADSNNYKRYLPGRSKPPANSDRIEQIFSGKKKKE